MAARSEAQADVEVSTLVVPAWRLRWQAPELALVLGERAVALASARRDEVDRLRAEALVVFAGNRTGRGVRIADRAMDALKAAEAEGEHETAWRLRVELAECARTVGAPLTGFAAVRPVLEAADVPEGIRAAALVQASECLVTIGRGAVLTAALTEADRLHAADRGTEPDAVVLQRGELRAATAAQHRRWGDLDAAVATCREGLELLAGLADPSSDNGQVRGRLTLELVCALLDADRPAEASEVGTPLLELPVRAPSASTSGWLGLALATRVHLPAGRVDQAREMLRDVVACAERHQLDTLLAETLLALAHVHEVSGDLTEALADLRSAHAAERRRARAVYAVRARLAAEFSGVRRQPVGLHDQLAALLAAPTGGTATAGGATTGTASQDPPTLTPEIKQQLRQWRPVQVHRGEGLRVKRTRRAAEDMTVEGISAARAHAADRWRLVSPFGTDPAPTPPDPAAEAGTPEAATPTPGHPAGTPTPTSPPSTPADQAAALPATQTGTPAEPFGTPAPASVPSTAMPTWAVAPPHTSEESVGTPEPASPPPPARPTAPVDGPFESAGASASGSTPPAAAPSDASRESVGTSPSGSPPPAVLPAWAVAPPGVPTESAGPATGAAASPTAQPAWTAATPYTAAEPIGPSAQAPAPSTAWAAATPHGSSEPAAAAMRVSAPPAMPTDRAAAPPRTRTDSVDLSAHASGPPTARAAVLPHTPVDLVDPSPSAAVLPEASAVRSGSPAVRSRMPRPRRPPMRQRHRPSSPRRLLSPSGRRRTPRSCPLRPHPRTRRRTFPFIRHLPPPPLPRVRRHRSHPPRTSPGRLRTRRHRRPVKAAVAGPRSRKTGKNPRVRISRSLPTSAQRTPNREIVEPDTRTPEPRIPRRSHLPTRNSLRPRGPSRCRPSQPLQVGAPLLWVRTPRKWTCPGARPRLRHSRRTPPDRGRPGPTESRPTRRLRRPGSGPDSTRRPHPTAPPPVSGSRACGGRRVRRASTSACPRPV